MVGVIEKRLSVLMVRFKDDKDVIDILLKIATKTHTAEDVRLLSTILRRLYFVGSLSGYTFQSQIVRRTLTTWGQAAAADFAIRKGTATVEKLIETLELQPNYRLAVKHTIEEEAVKEAFVQGQSFSAEENQLNYKQWLRVREPLTGMRRPHSSLEGVIIPRTEKFTLPDTGQLVDAPHDWSISNAARQWISCNHQILYVPYATREEVRASMRLGDSKSSPIE